VLSGGGTPDQFKFFAHGRGFSERAIDAVLSWYGKFTNGAAAPHSERTPPLLRRSRAAWPRSRHSSTFSRQTGDLIRKRFTGPPPAARRRHSVLTVTIASRRSSAGWTAWWSGRDANGKRRRRNDGHDGKGDAARAARAPVVF